jgi:hypothetical protein
LRENFTSSSYGEGLETGEETPRRASPFARQTDLRTLKSTLRLDQLTCCAPDLVAKEIDIGMAAYNLARGNVSGVGAKRHSPSRLQLHQSQENRSDIRPAGCDDCRCTPGEANLRSDDALRSPSETAAPPSQATFLSQASVE